MFAGVKRDVLISKLQTMQNWLLVAYAVSLPLTMTGSWALLTAGLITWFVQIVVRLVRSGNHDHDELVPPSMPLLWPLVGLALAVTLSGLFNGGGPKEGWRCLWSLKALLVYFLASRVFHYRPWVAKIAVQWLIATGAVAGIWGTIQQVANFHPFGYQYLQGTGFLSGPMPFAGQMQIIGLLSLGLLLTGSYRSFSKPFHNKYFFAVLTAANLSGLVFAGERSAWLGGLCGIMVLAAIISFKTFWRTALVLFVAAFISWQTVPLVHTRVESMLSGQQDTSTRVRLHIWKEAISLWQDHPITGVGFMSFPRLHIPEAIVPGVSKDLNHAHSNFLHFLATTGTVGVLAFAWLCAAILLSLTKGYIKARKEDDEFAVGLLAGTLGAMVSLMVSGLFEFNFGTAQVRLAQWFVLGFLSYSSDTRIPIDRRGSSSSGPVPDSLPHV